MDCFPWLKESLSPENTHTMHAHWMGPWSKCTRSNKMIWFFKNWETLPELGQKRKNSGWDQCLYAKSETSSEGQENRQRWKQDAHGAATWTQCTEFSTVMPEIAWKPQADAILNLSGFQGTNWKVVPWDRHHWVSWVALCATQKSCSDPSTCYFSFVHLGLLICPMAAVMQSTRQLTVGCLRLTTVDSL